MHPLFSPASTSPLSCISVRSCVKHLLHVFGMWGGELPLEKTNYLHWIIIWNSDWRVAGVPVCLPEIQCSAESFSLNTLDFCSTLTLRLIPVLWFRVLTCGCMWIFLPNYKHQADCVKWVWVCVCALCEVSCWIMSVRSMFGCLRYYS